MSTSEAWRKAITNLAAQRRSPAQRRGLYDSTEDPVEVIERLSRSTLDHTTLQVRLQHCSREWLETFLDNGGLSVLFAGVAGWAHSTGGKQPGLPDFAQTAESVQCMRAIAKVFDSPVAVERLLTDIGFFALQFVQGLCQPDSAVRSEVVHILCGLAIYDIRRHGFVLEVLTAHKLMEGFKHQFGFIVRELRNVRPSIYPHKTTYCIDLLQLVNSLLVGAAVRPKLQQEIHRSFIKLSILEVIDSLRSISDGKLQKQLETFDKLHHQLLTTGLSLPEGTRLDDVPTLYGLLEERAMESGHEDRLRSLLQHLLLLYTHDANIEERWHLVVTATCSGALATDSDDRQQDILPPVPTGAADATQRSLRHKPVRPPPPLEGIVCDMSSSETPTRSLSARRRQRRHVTLPETIDEDAEDAAGVPWGKKLKKPAASSQGAAAAAAASAAEGDDDDNSQLQEMFRFLDRFKANPECDSEIPSDLTETVEHYLSLSRDKTTQAMPSQAATSQTTTSQAVTQAKMTPAQTTSKMSHGLVVSDTSQSPANSPSRKSSAQTTAASSIPPAPAMPDTLRSPRPASLEGQLPPARLPSQAAQHPAGAASATTAKSPQTRSGTAKRCHKVNWYILEAVDLEKTHRDSLWKKVRLSDSGSKFDFADLEKVFSHQTPAKAAAPKVAKIWKKKQETSSSPELPELDQNSSMVLFVILRKFKCSVEQVVRDISEGYTGHFETSDELGQILSILPPKDTMTQFAAYKGDLSKLNLSQKFLHLASRVQYFQERLRFMVMQLDFPSAMSDLYDNLETVETAASEVMDSAVLAGVLSLVLSMGNVLNQGISPSAVIGFKLESLLRLKDTRSHDNSISFMNYLLQVIEEKHPDLLKLEDMLPKLQSASKVPVAHLSTQLGELRTNFMEAKATMFKTTSELWDDVAPFVERAMDVLEGVSAAHQRWTALQKQLADYVLEHPSGRAIASVFEYLTQFILHFKFAHKENVERKTRAVAAGKQSGTGAVAPPASDADQFRAAQAILHEIKASRTSSSKPASLPCQSSDTQAGVHRAEQERQEQAAEAERQQQKVKPTMDTIVKRVKSDEARKKVAYREAYQRRREASLSLVSSDIADGPSPRRSLHQPGATDGQIGNVSMPQLDRTDRDSTNIAKPQLDKTDNQSAIIDDRLNLLNSGGGRRIDDPNDDGRVVGRPLTEVEQLLEDFATDPSLADPASKRQIELAGHQLQLPGDDQGQRSSSCLSSHSPSHSPQTSPVPTREREININWQEEIHGKKRKSSKSHRSDGKPKSRRWSSSKKSKVVTPATSSLLAAAAASPAQAALQPQTAVAAASGGTGSPRTDWHARIDSSGLHRHESMRASSSVMQSTPTEQPGGPEPDGRREVQTEQDTSPATEETAKLPKRRKLSSVTSRLTGIFKAGRREGHQRPAEEEERVGGDTKRRSQEAIHSAV